MTLITPHSHNNLTDPLPTWMIILLPEIGSLSLENFNISCVASGKFITLWLSHL